MWRILCFKILSNLFNLTSGLILLSLAWLSHTQQALRRRSREKVLRRRIQNRRFSIKQRIQNTWNSLTMWGFKEFSSFSVEIYYFSRHLLECECNAIDWNLQPNWESSKRSTFSSSIEFVQCFVHLTSLHQWITHFIAD